jgi:hypothetical protein
MTTPAVLAPVLTFKSWLSTSVPNANGTVATYQQWRNMRTIEGAISKDENYQISPARVANIMGQKANRSVSIYGRGDTTLSDLANAANTLLGNKTPNSGTPSRLLAQAALPAAITAGEGLYSGDWKKAAELGAAAYALPKVGQKLINAKGPVAQKITSAIGKLGDAPNLPSGVSPALQQFPGAAREADRQREQGTQTP